MNKNGLSITMIFKAQSLNYGEGMGNISELKKLSRGDGSVYTFASRQSIRYDIVRIANKMFGWNLEKTLDKSKGTIQFKEGLTIEDSEEMDLFGYMKTSNDGSDVRSAAVRLSNAISLEEYKSDLEFLNNKGFADRIDDFPNLANIEQHLSYYTYTITIDLDKVGVDEEITLSNEERQKRIVELLEVVKILNREIRGREENLSPVFVIGGIYNINSPFYLGRIKLNGKNGKFSIDTDILKETMNLKIAESSIKEDTSIGIVKGIFDNENEINDLVETTCGIQEFFENIENKVKEFYK